MANQISLFSMTKYSEKNELILCINNIKNEENLTKTFLFILNILLTVSLLELLLLWMIKSLGWLLIALGWPGRKINTHKCLGFFSLFFDSCRRTSNKDGSKITRGIHYLTMFCL